MTLKTEAISRRLRVLLQFHAKLVAENKNQARMQEVANKIQQLTFHLERLNQSKMSRTIRPAA